MYALTLVDDIEDYLGLSLDPTVMWDHPTIAALTHNLLQSLAFTNPDAFDIRRDSRNHVGFGTLRLAGTIEELPFRHEMVLYGLKALPVTWSAAGGHSYRKEG